VVFALLNPIWLINGFRMYTAIQVFFFGALPYLLEGKKKYLLWAAASMLVHFSLFLGVVVLLGFALLPRKPVLYYWVFILTSFVKEIDLDIVRNLLYLLPDVLFYRVQSYTNIEYAKTLEKSAQFTNWYVSFSRDAVIYVSYILASYVFFFGREFLQKYDRYRTLFCFALLMVGLANLSSLIPGGGRFMTVGNLFMYAFFILYFFHEHRKKVVKLVALATAPLLFIFIVVSIRVGMDFTGMFTLIGNPLLAFFMEDNVPLIEYLK